MKGKDAQKHGAASSPDARRAELAKRIRERAEVLNGMAERVPATADNDMREFLKVVLRTARNALDDVADLLEER